MRIAARARQASSAAITNNPATASRVSGAPRFPQATNVPDAPQRSAACENRSIAITGPDAGRDGGEVHAESAETISLRTRSD